MAKEKYCIRSSRTHEECSRGCLFGRDGHRREGASSCRGGGRRRQTTSDSEPPYCRRLLRANCASSTRPYGTRSLCCVLWVVAHRRHANKPRSSGHGVATEPYAPNCLNTNPRLSRYHPCLSCLAGVRAVSSSGGSGTLSKARGSSKVPSDNDERFNLDGSLKNEDLFALGDDEDEDFDEENGDGRDAAREKGSRGGSRASSPPPAYRIAEQPTSTQTQDSPEILFDASIPDEKVDNVVFEAPKRHYIQKSETVLGIAFKYKVDVSFLCI